MQIDIEKIKNRIDIEGVYLTPLSIIKDNRGSVMHCLKAHEETFHGFGETYFSTLFQGVIKGWKRHNTMILNIVVPVGEIQFIMYDDRKGSPTNGNSLSVILSPDNYKRLTVPAGIWMAFRGIDKMNLLANVTNIAHDPLEADTLPIDDPQMSKYLVSDIKNEDSNISRGQRNPSL